MQFEGDRIVKRCYLSELTVYRSIFSEPSPDDPVQKVSLQKLKPYVPHFYEGQKQEGRANKARIVLENLLSGTKSAALMDIKIGTSTITL